MAHLEVSSILQDVIALTLDYCTSCNSPLSKADDSYVICFTCDGILCRSCHACPCDIYGVPERDDPFYHGEPEIAPLLQKS